MKTINNLSIIFLFTIVIISLLSTVFSKPDIKPYDYYNKMFNEFKFNTPDEIQLGCIEGDCDNGEGKNIYFIGIESGNFKNGKLHGKGFRTWNDGGISEGEWKNGEMVFGKHFYGLGPFAGDIYIGEKKSSKKHGIGTYKNYYGDIYHGNWENDLPNGYGKKLLLDGTIYEGIFINGELVDT